MRARQYAWNNQKLKTVINRYFVPVADEVGYLQFLAGKEKKLFRKIVKHPDSHYADRDFPGDTHQGIYAVAPSGILLESINRQKPGPILNMLKEALREWKRMPAKKKYGYKGIEKENNRTQDQYPEDGLVLSVFSRDLPGDKKLGDWRDRAWNMDYAWFKKKEARRFLPSDPKKGQTRNVPRKLVHRIARHHLIDSVHGQVPSFSNEAVKKATLKSTVSSNDGQTVRLELSGNVHMKEGPRKKDRSYKSKLMGNAVYNLNKEQFKSFELVAAGTRTGMAPHNQRSDDLGPSPMGHVLVLVPKKNRRSKIAPSHFGQYNW